MSEKDSRDGSTRRSSYRKSLVEAALPPKYLDILEEKRKQLDESIHKYIAAKEREYKQLEKDLKQQHRVAQGRDSINGTAKRRSPESTSGEGQVTSLEPYSVSAVDALLVTSSKRELDGRAVEAEDDVSRRQNRSTIAGLKDHRASVERDRDFVGLFTPPYLPLLNARDGRNLQRTTSAPSTIQTLTSSEVQGGENVGSFERANSDTAMQAKLRRPSQLALPHRTSSSGSSADGRLASALKSPAQRPKKRVSLAVGDAIVAPSDNVPISLSHNSTPSHSRSRSSPLEREYVLPVKSSSEVEEENSSAIESSLQMAEEAVLAKPAKSETEDLQEKPKALYQKSVPSQISSPKSVPLSSKLDADGDLFDLDEEESDDPRTPTVPDDLDSAVESEDEVAGRVDETDNVGAPKSASNEVKYDATTGYIPEPKGSTDNAVPYLAFGPSSAVASQQPTQPGFRRPSVVYDPVFRGTNYAAVEEDAVENDVYGSSYNRPSSKGSFTAGSLGESYMAQHAEEMMKTRSARQQTQVRS